MQTEQAELHFRQGSSDKVYHLQLENVEDQWSVQAQWGRRGSALQSDVKARGVTYEEAKRVYDRILREKVGKGYQIAEATADGHAAISVGLPATKEHSGHTPEFTGRTFTFRRIHRNPLAILAIRSTGRGRFQSAIVASRKPTGHTQGELSPAATWPKT
jgi:predicted DNA-binding WGR domain protein